MTRCSWRTGAPQPPGGVHEHFNCQQQALLQRPPSSCSSTRRTLLVEKGEDRQSIKKHFRTSGRPAQAGGRQRLPGPVLDRKRRNRESKPLFHHFTTAIDTENIRRVPREGHHPAGEPEGHHAAVTGPLAPARLRPACPPQAATLGSPGHLGSREGRGGRSC